MDIDHKNRDQLKAFFVTGAVPTEQSYADLIDGMLNQKDDGLVKQTGNPLCIEAAGDDASSKPALHLYDSFLADDPAWTLSMNPRVDPDDPETARRGLSIDDAGGTSRLFVDSGSGNVGIGTLEPKSRLHVAGLLTTQRLQVTEPEAWLVPEFHTKWVTYNDEYEPPGFMKDSMGWVHMRGMIRGGSVAANAILFMLPEGYRPLGLKFLATVLAGGVTGGIYIYPDGAVKLWRGSGVWLSLDSVHFQAHH